MPWSFPGILNAKELIYTQTVSFQPDMILMKCNPQPTNFAAVGTVTLGWDLSIAQLPNCVVDMGTVGLTPDGRHLQLKAHDRRIFWALVPAISGEYNTLRVGDFIVARKKSLRELAVILMTAMGEASANVSAVPNDVFPPVSWKCEDVVEAAQTLLEGHGFSVALGYGTEPVKVVQLGNGGTLPNEYLFVGTSTIDPKMVPRYIQNCFQDSVAQVRLKLEAVGLETNGSWLPIDSLSYKPAAGWGVTAPFSLPGVKPLAALTVTQELEAVGYVRRAYRISGFADTTLNIPDGSGVLSSIKDILPIQNRLLSTEDIRNDKSYQPFRVYGAYHMLENETGQPPIPGGADTIIGDRVTARAMQFDGETGLLTFEEPIWRIVAGAYAAADLWLECTIQILNSTNFSWRNYERTVQVVPTGTGYRTVRHEQRAETIVTYNTSHAVSGSSNNQATLDALAAAWSVAVAATYTTTTSQHNVYCIPLLGLRCDGAVLQVQHILTCGDDAQAVNRTVASRNFEFDRGIASRAHRMAHLRAMTSAVSIQKQNYGLQRRKSRDD